MKTKIVTVVSAPHRARDKLLTLKFQVIWKRTTFPMKEKTAQGILGLLSFKSG
mgnify:CR=1 FL=1